MPAISQLAYDDRFVRQLPADPRTDLALRQVDACFSRVKPTLVSKPELLILIPEVAKLLHLEPSPELVEVLAGNRVVDGMKPYAACYGGHQFGNWAGQLGDGRAITLGEVIGAPHEFGSTWEIQLKGAGPTPYSRRADGRAVLRSSLREVVCSEAMFHLGVPTTRALSLVGTGDDVMRDLLYDGHPANEPGAIACRVAPTFLRFGNFEIHASRDRVETLRTLVDYTIENYYPRHRGNIVGFFDEVMRRTAWMVCEWMRVGFVHGVMNTDNMSILGLTIDYGPYGWLEPFDLDWTPNTTDAANKRYRYGHQPRIAHWNCVQLARALAPLLPDPKALGQSVERFVPELDTQYKHMMLRKLGLVAHRDFAARDDELLVGLGTLLTAVEIDMTLFYRRLADVPREGGNAFAIVEDAYYEMPDLIHRTMLADWVAQYRARIALEKLDDGERRTRMNAINPLYVPRNYLLQEVIDATEAGDRRQLAEIVDVLRTPYVEQPGRERYAAKRPEWARVKPGCSMLSCSS